MLRTILPPIGCRSNENNQNYIGFLINAVQDNNVVVKTHGEQRTAEAGEKLWNHVDLVQLLDIVDLEKGVAVAGRRPGGWLAG